MRTAVLQAPATPRSARSAPAAPAGEAFRPRISARARARPARSAAEMSAGDRMRREAALAAARAAATADAARALTFRPRTNALPLAAPRVDLRSPAAYMARLRAADMARAAAHAVRAAQRQDEGLEECTFKPRTGQLPAFIARMARSYASARRPASAPARPRDWL